jgi:hypothetical protein
MEIPRCPLCGIEVSRRKRGRCPHCATPIWPYMKGRGKNKQKVWVMEKAGCLPLVKLFRGYFRTLRGLPEFDFVDIKPQLGAAKTLLDRCGGNQSMAELVIAAFFEDDTRRSIGLWQRPQGVTGVVRNDGGFNLAFAYAQAETERTRPKEAAPCQAVTF